MSPIRIAGIVLTAISAVIIVYNVSQSIYNQQVIAAIQSQSGWFGVAVSGQNLSPAYTFTPPFTGFEIVVMLAGLVGVVMIIVGKNKST